MKHFSKYSEIELKDKRDNYLEYAMNVMDFSILTALFVFFSAVLYNKTLVFIFTVIFSIFFIISVILAIKSRLFNREYERKIK